jgi:sec-independent protein translocase protein TatA
MFGLGTPEILMLLVLGVLLFGRRLPEVGRYLGKGIVEFKKGMKGLEDDFEGSSMASRQEPAIEAPRPPQRVAPAAPKFEDNAGVVNTPPQV